ncbi:DNA cytosine methyltransferase [Yersinia enterocolitica]|uniref:Cytosine-specific methyltransferase n=1 Tax=Yersinia enterocolitica TaxID=630 RepID=A0AAD2Z4Q3_YEREN|nr:DNA cytosine methyltransferase [Yersinia enterocolitica]EKN4170890.1 DNA cytosine methyltransferase [Yersinia enterocolitica]EKN6064467.1 DNA (cytosine-5-)-methyltransferase [Yersinia enterocolitica]ELI8102216.1 DNA cytosine methyltransferase [Yersinia enterocolitica]CQQ64982.1 Cytosine-specific methyltransferase [Yersinia enterocolitica]CRX48036.1 Cytosine-specific methyltransferase [Yersinia enterocolitica]
MKFSAIDLFCGAGGLTCGLKDAGFDVIAGVELEPVAAQTYRINHPDHALYEADIRTLDPLEIMNELQIQPGELDLLAGCPPCQGFSSHRTRNKATSVEDLRNDLIFDLMRFVRIFDPKTVMIENVPALAKDERIVKVINELRESGYIIGERTLQVKDTAAYGVPQRRKRMILLASKYGVISEPEKISSPKTVRDAISNFPFPENSGDFLHDFIPKRTDRIIAMIKLIPKDGGSRSDLPKQFWLPCHLKNPDGYTDVYGRMSWDKVSPTITGGCTSPSKGRFLHPEQDRAITLREAAMLQTFPKSYSFSLERGREFVALMIGNALPPAFICAHATKIVEHLTCIGIQGRG